MRGYPAFLIVIGVCMVVAAGAHGAEGPAASLRVGWASTDITPSEPVSIVGFHGKRISGGVRDRLMATALALESVNPAGGSSQQAILISCDLLWIRKATQEAVAKILKTRLADFDCQKLIVSATHTHQGPATETGAFEAWDPSPEERAQGVISGDEYRQFLADQLAEAAVKAWQQRRAGAVSWALDQAVVGFNRRFVYFDGTAAMLRPVDTAEFDCIEGVEDHGLAVLAFWDQEKELTGLVINVASPAQSDQGGNLISADFWHDVRKEIASRHSEKVFVLGQCGAAGDIYPHGMFRRRAEDAMAARRGITWRQEIARRIADGVDRVLPVAREHADMAPVFKHEVAHLDLPSTGPALAPFYSCDPVSPAVFHVVRLGDAALVTAPFEIFTDYAIRIQARSKAVLTFVVQLSCQHSGYLPTSRAVKGGGYSADRYLVDPDGGRVFADACVARINALWE
ncbi:MAG: hypothetical protein ACOX1P_30330 [Thermoguttaceae bacterium]|jgi:hypothetical protein